MCGIVGMAGDLSYRDKDVLRMMLVFSTVRGEDSTGVVAIPTDTTKDPKIAKVVGTPFDLFDTRSYDVISAATSQAIIGHTRKATMGVVNKNNAHPFWAEPLVGVHNGTLRGNWRGLPGPVTSLDSSTLYNSMASAGVRETIEQVDGAYALVWFNTEDQTLNFLRNKERTLFYAFSADMKKVFWASESWMITVACGKNGIELADIGDKDNVAYTELLEPDRWWSIKIRPGKDPIVFVRNDKLEGGIAKKAVSNFQRPYRSPFDWEGDLDDDPNVVLTPPSKGTLPAPTPSPAASTTTSSTPKSSTTSQTVSPQPRPTLSLVPSSKSDGSTSSKQSAVFDNEVAGHNGRVLDLGDYARTDQECCFCGKDVDFEDARKGEIGRWISSESFLCKSCYNNPPSND